MTKAEREMRAAFRRFMRLPVKEQKRRLEEAAECAERCSAEFERKIRIDPRQLWLRMTL